MSSITNASTSSGLIQTADTSGTLELQSNGTTQLTVSSTGAYGQLKSGTAQASTSGTSIDFTGIPSWVKRITVMFNGISTSGTAILQIQIGSGSVVTTGYLSQAWTSTGAGVVTSGFAITGANTAAYVWSGTATLTLIGSNVWISQGSVAYVVGTSNGWSFGGNSSALSGALDRVRITTGNGTDTFDAGSVNILYEG